MLVLFLCIYLSVYLSQLKQLYFYSALWTFTPELTTFTDFPPLLMINIAAPYRQINSNVASSIFICPQICLPKQNSGINPSAQYVGETTHCWFVDLLLMRCCSVWSFAPFDCRADWPTWWRFMERRTVICSEKKITHKISCKLINFAWKSFRLCFPGRWEQQVSIGVACHSLRVVVNPLFSVISSPSLRCLSAIPPSHIALLWTSQFDFPSIFTPHLYFIDIEDHWSPHLVQWEGLLSNICDWIHVVFFLS